MRDTLRFIGINESAFVRATSATFKQGIRFDDWVRTPEAGRSNHFLHPFEPPFHGDGHNLVAYWLLQNEATRRPFAEAMTIQNRVHEAQRATKRHDRQSVVSGTSVSVRGELVGRRIIKKQHNTTTK